MARGITWCAGVLVAVGLAAAAWQFRGGPAWGPRSSAPAPGAARVSVPGAGGEGRGRILAEGRLTTYPGARVVVSSEVTGVVTNLPVREQSRVEAGALLAEVRADDVYAGLMEARARVAELESELALARSELRRAQGLADTQAITPQELERHTRTLDTLEARRTTAQVTVRRLETTLAKTRILAPLGGVVLAQHVFAGEVVVEGTPVATLADLTRTRIEAEVDEYDAGRVELEARVRLRAEGYTQEWEGRVEEIPDQVGPRTLHPQDPAAPSDVRVLRVKVACKGPMPLKLGQRVEVEIECRPPASGVRAGPAAPEGAGLRVLTPAPPPRGEGN